MEKLTIVHAGPEDTDQIVALVNSAYRGESSKAGWTTEADLISGTQRTDATDILSLLQQPGTVILLAKATDGKLLGTVLLKKLPEARMYLGMLSVNPLLQAGGIGKQLMKASEHFARQHGCSKIIMQVIFQREELIAWYKRQGYTDTGERRPFPEQDNFGIPVVPLQFMVLEKALHSVC